MNPLSVLIACECSGAIRREFRALGHQAYSNDLLPASDGSPYHLQMDALEALVRGPEDGGRWDLVIAHPTCTRLALSGSLRLYLGGKLANGPDPVKWAELDQAAAFFRQFFDQYSGPLCVENPHMHGHALTRIGQPPGVVKQVVQPHEFGDDASKSTVLWLRGLPKLVKYAANYVDPRMVNGRPRWANQTDSGQNRLPPSAGRAAARAVTYRGLAEQMAIQWSQFLSAGAK